MTEDSRIIHIAIAFDQNYTQQFSALLSSVFLNSRGRKLSFHLIASGTSEEYRSRVQNYIIAQGAKAVFYQLDSQASSDLVLAGSWTQAVYHRLYFPELVSADVDRLLYLDSDTLVVGDLQELFQMELGHYPVAAVYDVYVKKQELIGVPEGAYFNSGVLLMDIANWRRQSVSHKVLSYLRQYPERILYVDQCGLNAVLKDNWKRLDYKFNVLYSYLPFGSSGTNLGKFLADKVILHFTLERPWNFLCRNRFRSLYWHYLKLSPLADPGAKSFSDFSMSKIPTWLKIRSMELYFDYPFLQASWKRIKAVLK